MPRIDFKALAATALSHADALLSHWLPDGHREGHEYKALNPTRADAHEGSFSVNCSTGAWADFATGEKGGDLVSLYAYLFCGGDNAAAAVALADALGMPDAVPGTQNRAPPRSKSRPRPTSVPAAETKATEATQKPRRSEWIPLVPAPIDADPPPKAHVKRGKPEKIWTYRDANGKVLGYVCRFRTSSGGKEILPLVFARHEKTDAHDWRWMAFPEPRPIYGLDRLVKSPVATVLIVEGEKCADAAQTELPDKVVVSWPGGAKAVDKVDWTPLHGRIIITFADCDAQRARRSAKDAAVGVDPEILPEANQPGYKAMARIREILASHCRVGNVLIPAPGDKPPGWDIADLIDEGVAGEALSAWIRDHLITYRSTPAPASESSAQIVDAADAPFDDERWIEDLHRTKQGRLERCVANVYDIMLYSRAWKGVVAFDVFAQRTVKRAEPPWDAGAVGEWDDNDDTQAGMWMTHHWGFAPDKKTVAEATEALAREYAFNPVLDYLRGLAWDETPRIDHWLIDHCGAHDTPYVRLVGRFFLIAMVGRVLRPGMKFDYCLVLEGEQGKKKSMIARVLGGDWFGDTDLDLHNKDSMIGIAGKWVYEFSEMGSINRSDTYRQKSFISRQFDEFRVPYGKRLIRQPRQVIFVGTTNDEEWNKDITGGRRFWPVRCEDELNPDGLATNRDQLLAEALVLFERGERYWPNPEEQRTLFSPEQAQRETQESLIDLLHDWVFDQGMDFSLAEAATIGLKLDASKLTRDLQVRIGNALKKLGCKKIEKRNGMTRFWYRPPDKPTAGTNPAVQPAAPAEGERRAPF
ncbi:MAG: hypothetical protein LBL72_08485 [Candidatus Accumulibacter sp.]|jgi:predicted P-loop ATPase|nr:hypothetical protein [Accumulibacter sp.]